MKLTSLILFTLFCFSCDSRTPSEERFVGNIGFSLPADKTVLRDEYQDMWPDYVIIYEVKLSGNANQELTKKIRTLIATADGREGCKWTSTDSGFSFLCDEELTRYEVDYDTIKGIVIYQESAD